ncbi:MAG: hypothetical protein JNL99_00940 [Zoogloea sp.]|nr:hypothetical protein [Zoogloea sp.]
MSLRTALLRHMPRSLQWRLALPVVSLLSVILLVYGATTALQQASTVAGMLNARAQNLARSVAAASVGPLLMRDLEALEQLLISNLRYGRVQAVQIIDAQGKLVADVEMQDGQVLTHFGRVAPELPPGDGAERSENIVELNLLGLSLHRHEGDPVLWQSIRNNWDSLGWVRVTVDSSPIERIQAGVWLNNLLLMMGVIVISIGGVFILLHRPLAELQRAANFARTLADSRGAQAPGCEAIAEINSLFQSLNQVSSSLASHERALLAAKDAAEQANRAKGYFLANVSHELRTPMNSILGLSDMLQLSELPGREKEFARLINDSGRQLLVIINDLIDFSDLDGKKVRPQQQPFVLEGVLAEVRQEIAAEAAAKGLALMQQLPPGLPLLLVGDGPRLRQALAKYAENAVKFTERGTVCIAVEVESREVDALVLRFVVEDSGIGIPEADQGRLFEDFEQVDASSTRKYGGTGLGLAIVRQIASLLGGTVGVSSTAGQGSRFWLTLRLGIAANGMADVSTPAAGTSDAPALSAAEPSASQPLHDRADVEAVSRELGELIRLGDISALPWLEAHGKPLLRASPEAHARLVAALQRFDFDGAEAALQAFETPPA